MSVYTVSQLNTYIASMFRSQKLFSGLLLRGEISNFVCHHKSGHCYFTLRDAESGIRAVMFRRYAEGLRFLPEDGMQVLVQASVSVFERDGVYQLYVTDMQPDGVGQGAAAFEQLKKKLAAMGVFSDAHKRPLPAMPHQIGVVTSASGAAVQDIIQVLSRRYPLGTLHLFPASVQGAEAPASIVSAIEHAGRSGCDVLIVGRGGGSSEDLAAFQTEAVVMAVYHCPIPVISAVGHETDLTLTDFAADLRAPTPSAAAELAAPDLQYLIQQLVHETNRCTRAFSAFLDRKAKRLELLNVRLRQASPDSVLLMQTQSLAAKTARLNSAAQQYWNRLAGRLDKQLDLLDAFSPVRVLSRGYALVYQEETLISKASQVSVGDSIQIRLGEGTLSAQVSSVQPLQSIEGE